MSFIQGFLLAVSADQKEAYREHALKAWPIFRDHGCLAAHENWGVDVPEGTVTSFPKAVKAAEGEVVVFAWMVWPDQETYYRAWDAIMADPRMQEMGDMPFDGQRMMWGGFEPIVSETA